jgi:hypothetical protein
MIARGLLRMSGMLHWHFASLDRGRRVTSHKRNFLRMVLNSFAVLHRAREDMSANAAPMRTKARSLKEKRSMAAIAGAGISEKPGTFRAVTWIKKVPMKATKMDF